MEGTSTRSRREPSVDVVITTHQGWELTRRCLEHLREQTVRHTVIVSDGASTDETVESIRTMFPNVVLLAHAADPGYVVATNRGVAAGGADVILLLNNDTYCEPDFLAHLLAVFEDERVGAAAPLTLQSDGRRIDGVGLTLDATLAPFIRLNGSPRQNAAAEQPLLVAPGGGADAYRRVAWDAVGGLDERLSFYGADVDLGLRLHASGWSTVAAPRAVAIHSRSATSGHRSRRARESGGWARGFLLRRWGVLRSRAVARTVITEALVVLADAVVSRDAIALRSRLSGWKAAGGEPRRRVPACAIDRRIGLIESLRLRWRAR